MLALKDAESDSPEADVGHQALWRDDLDVQVEGGQHVEQLLDGLRPGHLQAAINNIHEQKL